MLSSKEIANCINSKLDSMTTTEKEEYFRKFGVEVVVASTTSSKRKTGCKNKKTRAHNRSGGRTLLAASMVARNAK